MNLNEHIEQMRMEQPRTEAKGELILKLQQKGIEKKPMKLITKISIPTAVTAIAIVGGTLMFRPTVLASPSSVVNAIKEAMTYRIKSFNIEGNKKTLVSETSVINGKKSTKTFDKNGNEINNPVQIHFGGIEGIEGRFGLTIDGTGTLKHLPKEEINKILVRHGKELKDVEGGVLVVTGESGQVKFGGNVKGGDVKQGFKLDVKGGKSVEVKMTKDANGKMTKKYIVDGKEVKELPKGIADKIKVIENQKFGGTTAKGEKLQGMSEHSVEFFHNTKGVKMGATGAQIDISDGKAGTSTKQSIIGTKGADGKMNTFVSGQTSADYLVQLLKDADKWTIERNVVWNGQNLDKFTLKGPFSPIELYVDPGTSLPKVLRFKSPMASDGVIEDVYEYGIQP